MLSYQGVSRDDDGGHIRVLVGTMTVGHITVLVGSMTVVISGC